MQSADVIVVGGGLIGMMTARCLAMEGLGVVLLERGRVGRESSWAAGGALSPLPPWACPRPVMDLVRRSQVRYPALAQALAAETGIAPEWIESGLLVVRLAAADYQQALAWAHAQGVAASDVTGPDLFGIEPGLRPGVGHSVWMPSIAQIRPPRLLQAMRQSLDCHGVRICEGDEVVRLLGAAEGRIEGVETVTRRYSAGVVVVTAGAWSHALIGEWLPPDCSIEPVRGQMILFGSGPARLTTMVLAGHDYLIPRRDGRIVAGSTLEHVGFDKACTVVARESLRAMAVGLVPRLAEAEIEAQWAGLRPGSPSEVPMISPIPHVRGLYISAGHYRNGIAAAPESAYLMCDLILGRKPHLDASNYALPGRVSLKEGA